MIHTAKPMPVLGQTALALSAIRRLETRGAVVLRVECGAHQKPVIHIANNRAAGDLKDAESHLVCNEGSDTFAVMVTDYRGCQVQWTEVRHER